MKSDTSNSKGKKSRGRDKQKSATEKAGDSENAAAGKSEADQWRRELIGHVEVNAEADKCRRQWIEDGEMNGNDVEVMRSLYVTLPVKNGISAGLEQKRWDVALGYMAELWLRGVSKEQFIKETGLSEAVTE
ncbi:MAG: hypothetical protein K2X81_25840 [Candidatus Obscuribacterales bacterium]|jgi:hypothetical protein|nr:hypothetical protein [Candidatus Obscuribacterales bacterium]